jgi:hypothetical protein
MAVLALCLVIGRSYVLNSIPSSAVSPAAAESLVEALLVPLRTSLRLVFVVGLLIALAAFLGGHSRPAEYVRHGLATAGDYITGKIGGGQAKPWQLWLARYRRIIEATVVGIAVLVLIFWQDPTAAVAIWTAVLAGLVILVVELLCRPAVAGVPGAEPGVEEPGVESGGEPGAAESGVQSGGESVTAGGPPDDTYPTTPIPRLPDSGGTGS